MMTRRTSLGLAALALSCPGVLTAQERAVFLSRAGADTLAVEVMTRDAAQVEGSLRVRTPPVRVVQTISLAGAGQVRVLRTVVFQGARSDSATQRAELTFAGDSVRAHVEDGAGAAAAPDRSIAVPAGAMPFFNLSGVSLELLLQRARAVGGDSVVIPLLVGNGTRFLDAAVVRNGPDSVRLVIAGITMRIRTDAAGRLLGAAVPAQRVVIERLPGTSPAAAWTGARLPPSYAAPAGAPYVAQDVDIAARAGRLAGTLTLPTHAVGTKLPAVVLISGSGPQDRDESTPALPGWRPFREIADTLSRRGIAVLRLDDRGVGGSAAPAPDVTMRSEAEDVRDAVAWLRARSDIDPARVALVGHSSGGAVAPMVAAADPRGRAVVLLEAPASTGRKISEYQIRYLFAEDTVMKAGVRDSLLRVALRQADSAYATGAPWVRQFGDYDPLATARQVLAPTLVLHGETDRQVPVTDAGLLVKALRAGGNRHVTLRTFPRMNHLLADDASGSPRHYTELPDLHVRRDLRGALADWLASTLGAAR